MAPRVLGLRSVARSLALILALIATVFAITGVGILVVSPEWLNALLVVAAVVGLLSGVASIAVVEVMSSSLASSEKSALGVVQSEVGVPAVGVQEEHPQDDRDGQGQYRATCALHDAESRLLRRRKRRRHHLHHSDRCDAR